MPSSRHEWSFFERYEDGDQYFHECNMQFRDGALKKWPSLAIFGLAFEEPDHGLPGKKEFAAAVKIGKVLCAAMAKSGHAVHVSTVTGAGGCMWLFQCKSARATDVRFAKLPAKVRSSLSCQHADDPEWSLYNESLLPTEREELSYQYSLVLEQLAKAGDNPLRARPIEHLAYFPTGAARRKFVAWVKKEGYTLDGTPDPAPGPDSDPEYPFQVYFSRKSRPSLELITDQGFGATVAARRCKGLYDGWQAALVKKKK